MQFGEYVYAISVKIIAETMMVEQLAGGLLILFVHFF